MGKTLSVLLAQPFSDLVDVTEDHDETPSTTTPKMADSDVEPTPQRPTPQELLFRAPPTPYERKQRAPFKWRVVDAQSFIYKGVIRIVRVDDLQDLEVIAISYAWSDDIKRWREKLVQMGTGRTYEDKILRGSNRVSQALAGNGFPDMSGADQASISRAHLFFTAVAFLVFTRGKKFFWMDILCINQEEFAEKGFFVPQMATLYRNTYETHAYPSGTEISPSVLHESVHKPIWETRAWTVQEHILAKRVMFCYLFMGDVVDEVRSVAGHASSDDEPEVDRQLSSPVLDRFQYANSIYLLRRGEHVMTSHMEMEGPFGNFAGGVMSKLFSPSSDDSGINDWDMVREATSRSTMYKDIVYMREHGDLLAKARLCLEMLPMRKSTCPEDMIYSALGAFDMKDFVPQYDIGFEEARLRVFEGMGAMVLSHLLGVDWGSEQDGVHKDSSLPRIVGGAPTVGATYLKSSILDCKYDRTVGLKLRCRAERWRIWKPAKEILSMTSLTRYILKNDRLIIVQGTGYDQESLGLPVPSAVSTPTSQSEHVRNIVIDGSSIGINDEEYFDLEAQPFEQFVEFVEVGPCHDTPLVAPVANTPLSLVALCTNRLASGNHRNMGAALIADMDGFASEFVDIVIE